MGHFLAATAFRTESVQEVVQAISGFMQSRDVKHEVLPGSSTFNDATDAQLFGPSNGWVVVLWPNYFNVHDFPVAKALALVRPWLVSTMHVYDGDYWEHMAVQGADELHSFCSRPQYWADEADELERVAGFNPAPERIAAAVGVAAGALEPYLIDVDRISDTDAKAHADDRFPLSDFWVFTDFWRRVGITYPDPPENPASVVRLSKWFGKRLPDG